MKKLALLLSAFIFSLTTINAQEIFEGQWYQPMPLPIVDSIAKPKQKSLPTMVSYEIETGTEEHLSLESLPQDLSF